MNTHRRRVTVQQIPDRLDSTQRAALLQTLKKNVPAERPRVVLDCSKVERFDDETLHLLLCCLEEAMKRNGDVRLAGLSPAAEKTLRRAGLMQLFEAFVTPAAAIESYRSPFGGLVAPEYSDARAEDSAA